MSEEELPENYPKCQFCGVPMGSGLVLETSVEPLFLCDDCWRLLTVLIKDNVPRLLGEVLAATAEGKPTPERLKGFEWENWEKYVKKP